MRALKVNETIDCFKCVKRRKPVYGIWAHRESALLESKPTGLTKTARKLMWKGVGGPPRPKKTIKAPRIRFGGGLARMVDTRQMWVCDGPAYQDVDHPINRYVKGRSDLQKYFDGIMGRKYRKRQIKLVCLQCFKDLTEEYPLPSRPLPAPPASE